MKIDPLTDFDQALVHALHIAPRAPFRRLGEVLGTSDQTVARRYRKLRDGVGLRVIGMVQADRVQSSTWFVRLQCAPDAATPLARALAQRPDTAWVRLASGGTEIICVVHSRDPGTNDHLLLERLAGSRRIVGVSAHSILHVFSSLAWPRLMAGLSADQVASLREPGQEAGRHTGPVSLEPVYLDDADERLLELLAHDGRATPARLASAIGWHESTVRRRLAQLIDEGVLVFDIDLDERAIGITTNTTLWASVEPAKLQAVGEAMAVHPEVPFVAATTGATNLLASVVCDDAHGFFDYLTTRISRISGIHHVETAPVIQTLKRTGPVSAA